MVWWNKNWKCYKLQNVINVDYDYYSQIGFSLEEQGAVVQLP